MKNNVVKIVSLFALIALLLISLSPVFALEPIEFSVVDSNATGYGTFQSHNQKVVSNAYGIFISSLHSRNVVFGNNTWWLSRSTNGGKTFSVVYQAANTLHTPPIETDSNGNIYAIITNTEGGDATLLRFEQKTNFSNPTILATLPAGSAQKNAMILDWQKQQIYYAANHDYNSFASHDFRFYIIGLDGQIKKNIVLTQAGTSAYAHYPHLYMDESNTLYLAWTTTNLTATLYWNIHFMLSKDGGQSWQKPDGTKLSIPIIADETGSTDRIVPDNEYSVNTWLWNMTVKNGKIHLPYTAQGTSWVQHYVRYDLKTAKIDINVTPKWQGQKVYFNNTDGFCATKKNIPDYPIYCVSRNGDWRFGVLVSYDNGMTWQDYSQSDFKDQNIYAIGGSREITSDGYIIGTYTDQTSNPSIVRFFRVKVEGAQAPLPTDEPPTSGPRYSACDLCGYCPPNNPLSSWKKCRQCLYPDASSDPTTQDTLKVDPDSNQLVTPYPGRQYTFLGCISTGGGSFSQSGGASSVTQSLLNIVFSLVGGVAFLYLLYGSFVIATSQADPERLNYGKRLVWGAIIGLIFCLTSVLIVNFIAGQVLKIPGFGG